MDEKGDSIPDGEILYKYISPKALPPGQEELAPSIFSQKEMSCDWAKYQKTPDSSFHIEEGKTIIVSIEVCEEIRKPKNPKNKGAAEPAWEQEIIYDPITKEDDIVHGENISHSLIKGKKKGPVQEAITKKTTWRDAK